MHSTHTRHLSAEAEEQVPCCILPLAPCPLTLRVASGKQWVAVGIGVRGWFLLTLPCVQNAKLQMDFTEPLFRQTACLSGRVAPVEICVKQYF